MAPSSDRKRARRRFRPFRLLVILILLAPVSLLVPVCFRFACRYAILLEAWRNDVGVQIGAIQGSIYEPLRLQDTVWTYESAEGPITRVAIQTATAEFAWKNLFTRDSARWFQHLSLDGVSGKILLPLENRQAPKPAGFDLRLPKLSGRSISIPERIDAWNVDVIFQSDNDYVRLAQTQFTLSNIEPGSIHSGQILVHQPWINRTFREVRGTTKLQDATIDIANLTLEPGVQIRDISVNLGNLATGYLNLEMHVAAFNGDIRIEAQTLSEERTFGLDANGSFSQISIAKLATFLGLSDAAGGTIKNGKFTFRGPPQHLSAATASLGLEATNFQWDSRQWDSLVAGATLMDGRVQVPGLALTQGHNQLHLNGEWTIPGQGVSWWQSEFNVNIAAKIDNLTELSALLLPEFKFAAGKANIDGSIRGKDQQFNGQIIVSGSDLQWRSAPIDELHASVKLNGNEFQVTNLSIFNDGDFVRGRGVVNILGDKQYWGEVHASIVDLTKYSSILQKPLVPEPLAGGAKVEWSGEGSAKGHSGKFLAHLQKLRSQGALAALLHPINAELEGTYGGGGMTFSQFALSDDDSSFTANVAIGSKILSLQGIRLTNKGALWLEGDALLPLDVMNAWPNATFAGLLDDHTVSKLSLTAHDLELREASLLTGWRFPVEGVVNGSVTAEGPIGALKTGGKLTIHKARIPVGGGQALSDVDLEAVLDGHTLQFAKFTGRHPGGDFSGSGQVDFSNLRDPALQLAVTSQSSVVGLFSAPPKSLFSFLPISVTTSLSLKIDGPLSAGKVAGEAQVSTLQLAGTLNLAPYLVDEGGAVEENGKWPQPFVTTAAPWSGWSYDLHCVAAPGAQASSVWHPDPNAATKSAGSPSLTMDLRLSGPAGNPTVAGVLKVGQLPAHSGPTDVFVRDVEWQFRPGLSSNPSMSMSVEGLAFDEPFTAEVAGVGKYFWRTFTSGLDLNEKLIQQDLEGVAELKGHPPRLTINTEVLVGDDAKALGSSISLEVAPSWANGGNIYAWPVIAGAPLESPAPVAPTAAPPAPNAPVGTPAPNPASATPAAAPATPPAPASTPVSSPSIPPPPSTASPATPPPPPATPSSEPAK